MIKPKDVTIGLLFFMYYMSLSSWLPFYNLHLKEMGYSGTQVGLVAGMFQAALFFVVPIWGILSDRIGNKKVLRIALSVTTLAILGMRFIEPYVLMLFYILLLALFHHPLGTLLDSLAIHHIHRDSDLAFGSLRVWGSLGWAVGSTLMGGYLLDHQLSMMFVLASGTYLFTLIITSGLGRGDTHQNLERDFSPRHMIRVFGRVPIILFLGIMILYGIGVAPLYVFINLYYHDLGASHQIIGLAFAVQALSELPFFFYGRWFIRKFGSPRVILLVISFAALRMLVYSFISNPIIAVASGMVHGVTLSLFWVAVTDYLHALIPGEWRSTGQALIWATHLGAGMTLGNMSIGILSDYFHMRRVMLFIAMFTAGVFVITTAYFKYTGDIRFSRKGI